MHEYVPACMVHPMSLSVFYALLPVRTHATTPLPLLQQTARLSFSASAEQAVKQSPSEPLDLETMISNEKQIYEERYRAHLLSPSRRRFLEKAALNDHSVRAGVRMCLRVR